MINIKNKITDRTIFSSNDNFFDLDENKIYVKDVETDDIISFDRNIFYAEMPCSFGV